MSTPISLNGAVTFWSLTDGISLDTLRLNCPSWLSKLLPEQGAPLGALKRVLTRRIAHNPALYMRPVDRDGYVIMEGEEVNGKLTGEERGRVVLARVAGVPGDAGRILTMAPFHQAVFDEIGYQWLAERRRTTASDLGSTLSKAVVSDRIRGVPLRPTGGIYWVPKDRLPAWQEVAAGIEASGGCKVWTPPFAHGAESIRTVCDNLTDYVEKEMAKVNKGLVNEDLGERARATKHKRAEGLNDLVTHVEATLEVTLQSLRDTTTNVGDLAVLEDILSLV